jgi:hypothetical protein
LYDGVADTFGLVGDLRLAESTAHTNVQWIGLNSTAICPLVAFEKVEKGP